jgi:D-ribose pyranose/furanose isomerase RbsD
MLNQPQASQIVIDCIRATSHAHVQLAGTLDDAGIRDNTILGMISLIVNDSSIGVPSQNHRIDAAFFQNIDTDTRVLEVIDIVRTKSVPTPV